MTVRLNRRLGQFIASSPTLFPSEYVAEFQQTLDRAPPVPYSAIEAVLRRELGDKLDATFSYINPVPMATASVVRRSCRTALFPDISQMSDLLLTSA